MGPGSECLSGKEELGRGQRGFQTQLLTVCLSSHTALSPCLLDLNVILSPQLKALGLGPDVGDPAGVCV